MKTRTEPVTSTEDRYGLREQGKGLIQFAGSGAIVKMVNQSVFDQKAVTSRLRDVTFA